MGVEDVEVGVGIFIEMGKRCIGSSVDVVFRNVYLEVWNFDYLFKERF